MNEPPDWRTPAIGLLVVGGLLLAGGGIKLSAAGGTRRVPSNNGYPTRKPYRPTRRVVPAPPGRIVPAKRPRQVPAGVDRFPGAEDRATLRSDPEANSRAFAATSLATYRPIRRETISALMEALQDQDALVRSSAADTLGGFGRTARRARNALSALRRDPDPEVRRAVNAALRKIR